MQQKDIDEQWSRLEKAHNLAILRVRVAAQRLRDNIRFERRYNPDWSGQPRVPAGDAGGGQWAGNGADRLAMQKPQRIAAAGGYSVGKLITQFMTSDGRRCVYKFDFGAIVIPAGQRSFPPPCSMEKDSTTTEAEAEMPDTMISPNFTISAAAKSAFAGIKADMTRENPGDPPAVATVGWGMFYDNKNTKQAENVVVSFYPRSMLPEIEHGIRIVSGIPLVFFVTRETAGHFDRRILDFDPTSWFFLRDP